MGSAMTIKKAALVLSLLFTVSCATTQEKRLEYISQDTKFYKSSSFEDVWRSSMNSIEELGFMIREAIKDRGFLDAIGEQESMPDNPLPILNVMIIEEMEQIKVNCLVLMSSDQDVSKITLSYLQNFFKKLDNNLKN